MYGLYPPIDLLGAFGLKIERSNSRDNTKRVVVFLERDWSAGMYVG
jgi:hypothetical protein